MLEVGTALIGLANCLSVVSNQGDINVNQLTGSIPPELSNLNSLNNLNLSYNQLSGNVPAALGYLSGLAYITSI